MIGQKIKFNTKWYADLNNEVIKALVLDKVQVSAFRKGEFIEDKDYPDDRRWSDSGHITVDKYLVKLLAKPKKTNYTGNVILIDPSSICEVVE